MSSKENAPPNGEAFWAVRSLTMSYFHTGIRTIIGAKSFHGPVRDGKEWYQLAMVIRHNLLSSWSNQDNEFIEFGIRFFVLSNRAIHPAFQLFWMRQLGITALIDAHLAVCDQSYRVKPHEQLVSVSLTHYCASTPDLSTSWSWTTL